MGRKRRLRDPRVHGLYLAKASNWPAKQKILVEGGIRRVIALQTRPQVRSVTVVLGPDNGQFYGLPAEYNAEMPRHAEASAMGGCTIIDPWPLLAATTREDGYHMQPNEVNTCMSVSVYRALIRRNFACRRAAPRRRSASLCQSSWGAP